MELIYRVIFIQIPNNTLIYLFLFDIILLIKGGFKINYKEKKIINKISFILIGLFIIAIGFYNLHSSREFFKTAKTTSATITNINKTQRIEKKKKKRKTVIEYSFLPPVIKNLIFVLISLFVMFFLFHLYNTTQTIFVKPNIYLSKHFL